MEKKNPHSEPFIFSLIREHLPHANQTTENHQSMSNLSFYLLLAAIALFIGLIFTLVHLL